MIKPTKIVEDLDAYQRVVDELRTRLNVDQPREGIHVSELLFCVREAWALRRVDSAEGREALLGETTDETMLVWAIGHSHEAILGQGRPNIKAGPLDDIVGNIDWMADDGIWECKSTRASAKKSLEDIPHYTDQVAAYCYMMGQTEAHVSVLHLMGDYNRDGPPKAILKVYKVTFAQKVLRAWWEELLRRKALLLGLEAPPLESGASPSYEWKCGYCRIRALINCPGGEEWQAQQAKKKQKQDLAQT